MSEPYIGEIKMFAGTFVPLHYALCDGSLLAVSDYQALFSLIGAVYGGNGNTSFGLPDFRGRIPVHQGQGPGLSPRPMAQKIGAEYVKLTIEQIPNHNHPMQASKNAATSEDPASNILGETSVNGYDATPENAVENAPEAVSDVGEGEPHYNMMPYQCINFIIALNGVYPART